MRPGRDVPDCYGSWRAVYALFRRWQRAGAWAQIVTALQTRADAAGLITWDVSVDSTIARGAPARRRRPPTPQASSKNRPVASRQNQTTTRWDAHRGPDPAGGAGKDPHRVGGQAGVGG